MLRRIGNRFGSEHAHLPSPALVVSLVALLVSLGGTTYAAIWLPANSVGTKQITNSAVTEAKLKNGAVTRAKLRNGAVTSAKVKNYSLVARDFKPGQLPAGPPGPQGPPGPTSAAFVDGPCPSVTIMNDGPPTCPLSAATVPGYYTLAETTIATRGTSRLLVFGSVQPASLTCGAGHTHCLATFALSVDSEMINGSAVTLTASSGQPDSRPVTIFGLSNPLPAGTHTLELQWAPDPGGQGTANQVGQAMLAGIAGGG